MDAGNSPYVNPLADEVESLRAKLERMAADELAVEGHYQETIESLRARLSQIETRAQQIRGGLKPYARPVEIVDYLMGEQP